MEWYFCITSSILKAQGHSGILLPETAYDITNPIHFAEVLPKILMLTDVTICFMVSSESCYLQLSAAVAVLLL